MKQSGHENASRKSDLVLICILSACAPVSSKLLLIRVMGSTIHPIRSSLQSMPTHFVSLFLIYLFYLPRLRAPPCFKILPKVQLSALMSHFPRLWLDSTLVMSSCILDSCARKTNTSTPGCSVGQEEGGGLRARLTRDFVSGIIA